ncbi:ribosome biogenesis GTPase RsgA [Saccharobesus litoralis]|uniref:Small ribosomal subunit biogenesis GTPase RsgA n=1 Tax=Saccharobesus litoralis TaxID=2172099 RepID=A0A2S0VWL3_9ALTE|nr:small ribosomal subunit biogenesis GTPase RsgA [Saccharobesus litoralis]AWB68609.1 ribosome biogenesis GTPase RsgA [Saccharobesus litoralis]
MAKKKKLNQQQIRRLKANHSRKLEKKAETNQLDDSALGATEAGIVVSRFGQHADIQDSSGVIKRCDIRRTIDSLVSGDKVVWRPAEESQSDKDGVIEAVQPRSTVLSRPDFYDGLKPVAANIDQVVIVSAIKPELSLQILDRYLVAVENMGARPVIAINKVELLSDDELNELHKTMAYYENLGYDVHLVSVKQSIGLDKFNTMLADNVSIVVGQSGVGKSSLVNYLLPDVQTQVNEVSDVSGLGQHTTTVSRLYNLPCGGYLIDSPGVREFSLWHLSQEEIFDGFIEFSQYKTCKFRDCSHQNTPKCGIIAAVESGHILPSRLAHYFKIIESNQEDKPNRF